MGQVISGWDEGIGYMHEGGAAILIVPSALGYGSDGYSSIPGYTPLVFTVVLVDIL
jgi:FKBP-type peptidyl-prolyl cis-trans isomerase FkpA